MNVSYFVLLVILLLPCLAHAFPEDNKPTLEVEATKLSWILPTTDKNGNPLSQPLDHTDVYCSNTPNVNKANTTFQSGDLPGTTFEYMLTNFADGQWYCRVTATIVYSTIDDNGNIVLNPQEGGYSNERNFTAVGGAQPAQLPPGEGILNTK